MATTEKWAKLFKSRHQYADSVPIQFGDAKDLAMQWDGTNLTVKPVADDTGAFIVGDGTTDMDFKVFMGTTSKHVLFDQSAALVTFTATALTLGADTAGTDFKLFGATTGNYLLWDASEDDLTLVGTATQLAVAGTTAASSATTGSIHTAGGIGIAGALWVGTTSRLVGAVTSDAGISNTGDVASSLTMTTPSLRSASTGNVAIIINASGSGTIGIGSVSTGAVTITPATTISGLLTLSAATGISLTGTLTKGINFASATPAHADADDAFIAIGTWNDAKAITGQAYHFVPIQVNLTSGTSVAADIAAARFRVNTVAVGGTANTLTAVNVLELRSQLEVAVGSHANLQVSTTVSENIACTGDLLVGYFSLQGDGAITCGNHVNVLEATCVMSSGASGVDNVAHFTMNSTGVTATNALKVEAIAGTLTNLVNVANTSGTVTNGIDLSGAMSIGVNVSTTGLHATTGRVGKFFGTVAAPNQGDGYGAFEVDITTSGTVAGMTNAFSSWLNLASGTIGANVFCAQNNGIWVATGVSTASAKMIIGARMQYVDTDGAAPSSLYLFSTNIYSNVLTAMFDVNAAIDLNWATAGWTGGAGHIPLFRDASAGVTYYVNVYTAAS